MLRLQRHRRKEKNMSVDKMVTWGALGAAVYILIYFRGDLQRYVKMKMM